MQPLAMDAEIAHDARMTEMAKVRQARRLSPGMKFRAGADLFEEACQWTLAGIAAQFPQLDASQRREILARRLKLSQQ